MCGWFLRGDCESGQKTVDISRTSVAVCTERIDNTTHVVVDTARHVRLDVSEHTLDALRWKGSVGPLQTVHTTECVHGQVKVRLHLISAHVCFRVALLSQEHPEYT